MSRKVSALIGIFLLGMIAGSGLGLLYGKNAADEQREQRIAALESQAATATENYTLMVREYNKLYALKAGAIVTVASVTESPAAPAAEAPAAQTAAAEATAPAAEAVSAPAAAETPVAPTAVAPEAAAEATTAPEPASAPAAAAIVADFKAESQKGSGPLEGPPPQPFQFTDLSTGEITSWKWDFGDGQTSEEQNPKHIIEKCPMDLCTVTLTVCGPAGCDTETKVEYLWVSEQCTGC